MQYDFGFAPRPKLSLQQIEAIIKKYRILTPCPSRQTLTEWCEEGVFFEAIRVGRGGMWFVFEDSFRVWIASMQGAATHTKNQTRLAA